MQTLYGMDHVGKLADTGGLDDDAVRMIFLYDLFQRGSEIAHQRAADTAGVHLADLNSCILQETAVDTDLTKFIFNQNDLLAFESVLQKFLIRVVFPAPRKPEIISIFVILCISFYCKKADEGYPPRIISDSPAPFPPDCCCFFLSSRRLYYEKIFL